MDLAALIIIIVQFLDESRCIQLLEHCRAFVHPTKKRGGVCIVKLFRASGQEAVTGVRELIHGHSPHVMIKYLLLYSYR